VSYFRPQKATKTGPRSICSLPDSTQNLSQKRGRVNYKRAENGITVYNSMVCTKRNSYWLSWNFATPSQQDLDDAVNTLQPL
jgi:hypothetical protein